MATPTVRASRVTPSSPSRVTSLTASAVLVALGVLGLGVLLIVVGALLPGAGMLGVLAPLVVPDEGPALVVVALVAALHGALFVLLLRGRLRAGAVVVTALCLLASLALGAVVGTVVATTTSRGGSIDLWRAVLPSAEGATAVDERTVYTVDAEGTPLHLSVQRPRGARVEPPAPIMVIVHGGGWIGGSDLSRAADARRFADRGWLAVSVEYSLARPGRPTWDVDGPQVACAMTQVVAHAAALGGDPSRLVLSGDSAGGQLAVSVAYHAASGDQPSSCGGTVPVPRAVAADYPAVDLAAGYHHGARSTRPSLDAPTLAVTYTGGTPTEVPDRYRAVSGTAAITHAAPPTLVIAPTRDALVPPTSLDRFVRAAQRAGVDATLVPVPFANHAFDALGDGSLGQQVGFSVIEHWSVERLRTPR